MTANIEDLLRAPGNGEHGWTPEARAAQAELIAQVREHGERILSCANDMEKADTPREAGRILGYVLAYTRDRRVLEDQDCRFVAERIRIRRLASAEAA